MPDKEETPQDAGNSENPESPELSTSSHGRSYKILVVEDSSIIRKVLVKILCDAGHVCDQAKEGHEGLAFMRRAKSTHVPYDLVITDLLMPEMDGWTFIDNLVERHFFPEVPVVIITAEATLESVKRSGKLGIKNFIVKPFDPKRVLDTVSKAVTDNKSEH